jgi:hypothetical protein
MRQPKQFEVLPENWDAVLMFLRIESQWRPTQSGVMGLDYGVLLGPGGLMELYGVEDRRGVFEGVQVMEAKARQLINDKATKEIKSAQQTVSKGRR